MPSSWCVGLDDIDTVNHQWQQHSPPTACDSAVQICLSPPSANRVADVNCFFSITNLKQLNKKVYHQLVNFNEKYQMHIFR